jgi:hypothetical protein
VHAARWQLVFIKDRRALGAAFRKWSDQPDFEASSVSHGDIVTNQPRKVLDRLRFRGMT